jgi:hypothetical protein
MGSTKDLVMPDEPSFLFLAAAGSGEQMPGTIPTCLDNWRRSEFISLSLSEGQPRYFKFEGVPGTTSYTEP